jgi:hypothetical protein
MSSQDFARCLGLLLYSHPVFVYVMSQTAGKVERANYPVKHEPGRTPFATAKPNAWYLFVSLLFYLNSFF